MALRPTSAPERLAVVPVCTLGAAVPSDEHASTLPYQSGSAREHAGWFGRSWAGAARLRPSSPRVRRELAGEIVASLQNPHEFPVRVS
jgi:hypothetical protein